jgi:hypothetical protein
MLASPVVVVALLGTFNEYFTVLEINSRLKIFFFQLWNFNMKLSVFISFLLIELKRKISSFRSDHGVSL